MPATVALRQSFIFSLHSADVYRQAATEKAQHLSRLLHSGFNQAAASAETVIKPVFNALADGSRAMMDKVGKMGKLGQALFDKPGMEYGGNNLVVGMLRKIRRLWRDAELKSLDICIPK